MNKNKQFLWAWLSSSTELLLKEKDISDPYSSFDGEVPCAILTIFPYQNILWFYEALSCTNI